jgi:hypothetical protein
MDANKKNTIEKIYRLTLQDKEFDAALRKKLGITAVSNAALSEQDHINEIYELCIEQIMRKQGEEFYADFPIESLRPQLIEDYNRMEHFRRKDDFYDFCLAMYQQIENITNHICADPTVEKVASKMWAYPAYINYANPTLEDRTGTYLVAQLLFPWESNGIPNYLNKTGKALSEQSAVDKMRNVVYFIGYKTEMKNSDYKNFKEICGLLNELYQCRNHVHRPAGQSKILEKIDPVKSFYYSKFHGLLSQYVEFIKNGYPMAAKLIEYTDSLENIAIK